MCREIPGDMQGSGGGVSMRILLIMDPGIPVPPILYGGHERLVSLFAEEYQKLGHEVTLLAGPESHCSGKTVTFGTNDLGRSKQVRFKEARFVWKYLRKNRDNFDLIHNFGRLVYLLPILNSPVKKIMTYGRPVATGGIKIVNSLPNRNLIFTACSDNCVATGNIKGHWETVYNAIDFSQYTLNYKVGTAAPLMFLGRLDRIKGAHTAIDAAKATNNQLVIAGNVSHTEEDQAYFKTVIEPQIDGTQIKYVGPLNDAEKNMQLGQAQALLFPIEWDEPFGMVMIEAMACGTPVIAFRRGSVPEVVENGITGFIVDDAAGLQQKIAEIDTIDRFLCRKTAMERFNAEVIAHNYLQLFNK
ncbi:glycosyltransferase family 4 protein [Mucilaginibacter gotjawali]|uniref:Glycosyltransferase involved in cell wall biosynthesis n=1 Tax=Mucilaginibacter gotjawali TaxID=1550579 RepID=A0A839SIJ7_9SPHI|nr:glycosyltransferase family 4 protein [Mucilaginibacter gotjawali]MBB3057104.1 glycosyltransferase involved in cell wall biosynthesis [Mucilaginibacter gotjawali]